MRAALKELHGELTLLDRALRSSAGSRGSDISAADCVVFPAIESILRAAGKDAAKAFDLGIRPLEKTSPALAAWCERVRALPGYERTYPPHWRAAPQPVAAA